MKGVRRGWREEGNEREWKGNEVVERSMRKKGMEWRSGGQQGGKGGSAGFLDGV